jgi:hypothetical protein
MPSRLLFLLCCLLYLGLAVADAQELPWYRTTVPPIAPERWTQELPPIPPPATITRDDYFSYIQEKWFGIRPAALAGRGKAETRQQWRGALSDGFMYQATGDEQYALSALEFLKGDYRYRTEGPGADPAKEVMACPEIIPTLVAYHRIRQSPSLTPEDHALIRELLEFKIDHYQYYECGAMNRGMGGSACVKIVNFWYPEAADKPLTPVTVLPWLENRHLTRQGYVDYTWPHWWNFRQSYENSSGYEAHGLEMVLAAMEITGEHDLIKDPGLKALGERFLAQLTPNGGMPAYGDATGFNTNPGSYIAIFEILATAHQDGRFKWAAHRMFDLYRRHVDDYAQWGNPIYDTAYALMEAYLAADETLQPIEPSPASVITWRKDFRRFPDYRPEGRHGELMDRDIPAKLCQRTGWQPDDAYALVELCKPLSHHHANPASLDAYVSDDSILLASPIYLARAPIFHNMMQAWPSNPPPNPAWSTQILHGENTEITVPVFHTTRLASYARIHVEGYLNGPTTLDRRVFFLGKRGIWLRDTLTAAAPFEGTIGPAYQFVGVYPERGDHWVNACQTSVTAPFLWQPQYMMQWTNRPRDLLVYYLPREDARLVLDDVSFDRSEFQYKDPPFNAFTDRVWYQQQVAWQGGESATFDSLLLPHAPTPDYAELAAGISSLLDEGPERAAVRATLADGSTLYLGINAEGQPLQAGPVQTDARCFVVCVGPEGATDFWAVEATHLQVEGGATAQAGQRATLAGGDFIAAP